MLAPTGRAAISLVDVTKRFGGASTIAVDALSFEVAAGEVVALVGPSGCGETTTPKMINRLVEPTSGTIMVLGADHRSVAAHELRRSIGYVIQQIGLFPHRTVRRNIGVVPELIGWDTDRIDARCDELAELVGLEPDLLDRYPAAPSGGQQQRAGVARALAADPPILLMDEPYSAVDPIIRARLQDDLLALQATVHKTIVIVTHDIDEAIELADRVAIMNVGGEYAASALEFLNDFAGEATCDADATVALLQTQLESRGLVAFEPSPAIDSNSFVVTAETAEELGLENVSDLTADLRLGGPADCPDNASCLPGLSSTYDLDLSESFTPLDGGGPLTVAALDGGEIDVAILFSTDGTIADKGWVVLNDDKGLINADNIVPVRSQELVDTSGDALTTLINQISASLDTAELTELDRRVGIELEDADAVAASWLEAERLVS